MAERAPTVGGNRDRTRSVADYVRLWHGACNAYCRDGRHAGEFPPDRAAAEALLGDVGALLAALAAAEAALAARGES